MQREIIEEDERPRSLHSLCKLVEERLEVNSVDRPLLCQHRDDLATQIYPCDDCNSFKSQLVLQNLKWLFPWSSPVSRLQLITSEDCFVNEDDVLSLLDQLDNLRQHQQLAFGLISDLLLSQWFLEFQRAHFYAVLSVDSAQLIHRDLSTRKTNA